MTTTLSNLERLQEEIFSGIDLEWKVSHKLGEDLPYAETGQAWYFNKRGTDIVYEQLKDSDEPTTCYGCDNPILIKNQTVNVWGDESLGPCAVTETKTREVRYCPNCEEEPESSVIETR